MKLLLLVTMVASDQYRITTSHGILPCMTAMKSILRERGSAKIVQPQWHAGKLTLFVLHRFEETHTHIYCCIFIISWYQAGADGWNPHCNDVIMSAMASQSWGISPASRLFTQSFFRRRSKKISKLRVTSLCAGSSPVTSEFPALKGQ